MGKCFFKPKLANSIAPHGANMKNEILCYSNKTITTRDKFNYFVFSEETMHEFLFITNHYRFQSLEFYTNIKCSRGDAQLATADNGRNPKQLLGFDKMCIITPFSLKNGTLKSEKNIIAPFQA